MCDELTRTQEQHYYPFGMELPGLSYDGGVDNEYRYNGKEHEKEHELHWYHYGARFYDPQLGRWWVVDAADQYVSPYLSNGNNPIYFVDPDGNFVWGSGGSLSRGFLYGASYGYAYVKSDGLKGFMFFEGSGLALGLSWSDTYDQFHYDDMNSIFDLAVKQNLFCKMVNQRPLIHQEY
jgi:RHS repeat-associated protein